MKKFLIAMTAVAGLSAGLAQPAAASIDTFTATLSGANEFPPNVSLGTGNATVIFDTTANTMEVIVDFTGLSAGNTAAHIHCCTGVPFAGTAGVATVTPTFTGFPSGVTSGTYDHVFDMTLASSYNPTFVTNNGGLVSTAEAVLLAGILGGSAYLNIHSTIYGGGEIRGFLTLEPVPEPASLFLIGAGLAGLSFARRKRSRAA